MMEIFGLWRADGPPHEMRAECISTVARAGCSLKPADPVSN